MKIFNLKLIVTLFSFILIPACGSSGGGSATNDTTSLLVKSISNTSWSSIESVNDLCDNQKKLSSMLETIDFEDESLSLETPLSTLHEKIASLNVIISSANVTQLTQSEQISSANICIEELSHCYETLSIENREKIIEELNKKFKLTKNTTNRNTQKTSQGNASNSNTTPISSSNSRSATHPPKSTPSSNSNPELQTKTQATPTKSVSRVQTMTPSSNSNSNDQETDLSSDSDSDTQETPSSLDSDSDTQETSSSLDSSSDTQETHSSLDSSSDTQETPSSLDSDSDTQETPSSLDSSSDTQETHSSLDLDNTDRCTEEIDECGVCNGPGKQIWYQDLDDDDLGNPTISTESCTQPDGYTNNDTDSNDFCTDTTCFVTTNSLENYCSNESGCSLMAALENDEVNTINFKINSDLQEELTLFPTQTIEINKSVTIYGCNKTIETDNCPINKQIRIDGSHINFTTDMNSTTLKVSGNDSSYSTVNLHDLIIENNTNDTGIMTEYSTLNLNGNMIVQNNHGEWAGGIIAGYNGNNNQLNINDNSKVQNNSSKHSISSGGILAMNTSVNLTGNSTIQSNSSNKGTGGVLLHFNTELSMSDASSINNNNGLRAGGILFGYNSIQLFDEASINNNQSETGVSAILNYGNGKIIVNSSTIEISNNSSSNSNNPAVSFVTENKKDGMLFFTDPSIQIEEIIHSNTNLNDITPNYCSPIEGDKSIDVLNLNQDIIHHGTYINLICDSTKS